MSNRVLESQLTDMIETIEDKIDAIENGDIGFSEAGDFLHNRGGDIISVLKEALNHVRDES